MTKQETEEAIKKMKSASEVDVVEGLVAIMKRIIKEGYENEETSEGHYKRSI